MNKILTLCGIGVLASTMVFAAEYGERENGPRHPGKFGAMLMKMMDGDNDGKVSRAEFNQFHDQRFTRMDADNDGFLTQAEAKDHHGKMREERRERRQKSGNDDDTE